MSEDADNKHTQNTAAEKPPQAVSGGVEVNVWCAGDGPRCVEIGPSDTLRDVKVTIAAAIGARSHGHFDLQHLGTLIELTEDEKIAKVGLAAGDELHVTLRDDPDYRSPRKQFKKAVGSFGRPTKFCVTGEAGCLAMPSVSIGSHVLGWPLPPEQKEVIVKLPQCERRGEKCYVFGSDSLRFRNMTWDLGFSMFVSEQCRAMGVEGKVVAKLRELVIYEEGNQGDRRVEMLDERGFGALILVMPSLHSGGGLVVRHEGEEELLTCGGGEYSCGLSVPHFAAFYTGCRAEMNNVTTGHKVEFIYELVHTGRGPLPALAMEEVVVHSLHELDRLWVAKDPKTPFVGHYLSSYYSETPRWAQLSERDKLLGETLLRSDCFDVCLVSAMYTAIDNGWSVDSAQFESVCGVAFPAGTPYDFELGEAVTSKMLDPKYFSDSKYFTTKEPDDSSADSLDEAITLRYYCSAFIVWPRALRHRFLGTAPLIPPLKEMLHAKSITRNILDSEDIPSYFTLCIESCTWETHSELLTEICNAASNEVIPVELAAGVLRRITLTAVRPSQLVEHIKQLLPRGGEVRRAFIELVKDGCERSEAHALIAINLTTQLAGAGNCEARSVEPIDDVELLSEAGDVIVKSLERTPMHSGHVEQMHLEQLVTIILVLDIVDRLGKDRLVVFDNLCANVSRFCPLILVDLAAITVRHAEEASVLWSALLAALKDGVRLGFTFCYMVAVIRLIARTDKVAAALADLNSCPCWAKRDTSECIQDIILGDEDGEPAKVRMLADPSWAGYLVEDLCSGNDLPAAQLCGVLGCLKRYEEPPPGSVHTSWQMKLMSDTRIKPLLAKSPKVTMALFDETMGDDCLEPDAEELLVDTVLNVLQSRISVASVKGLSLRAGWKECKSTKQCECSRVKAFLRAKDEYKLRLRKHHPCIGVLRENLGMRQHTRGYKGAKVDMVNEGLMWCLVKKVEGKTDAEIEEWVADLQIEKGVEELEAMKKKAKKKKGKRAAEQEKPAKKQRK